MLGNYLIRGLMIGLVFGVPAGAIGALTSQRTLNGGLSAGLATGLGSSAADLLYACVGVFGITLNLNPPSGAPSLISAPARPTITIGRTTITFLRFPS